jgi:integrase
MIKVPAKYNRCGIKIWCLKCRTQVSATCKASGKSISACVEKSKLRYCLLAHVPGTNNDRRRLLLDTSDFYTALAEMKQFRDTLIANGYTSRYFVPKRECGTTLVDFSVRYLDAITGVNTPEHLIRKRSPAHVSDVRRTLERFALSLKEMGRNPEILSMNKIGDDEVGSFHEYLSKKWKITKGSASYNRHFAIMRAFFNWVIEKNDHKCNNPFKHVELNFSTTEKAIITKEEFEKLLEKITFENGYRVFSGKRRNLYHEWLAPAFRLAIETGLRSEELVTLSWSDLKELEPGKFVFRVSNLKVNRIKTGQDDGRYIRYIPVTKSLMELLIKFGFESGKLMEGFVLARPEPLSIKYVMSAISRGFNHYIKQVTDREIEFNNLRKTYITRITSVLGPNAKLFTGHSSDEVLKKHYLSNAYLAGSLGDFTIL